MISIILNDNRLFHDYSVFAASQFLRMKFDTDPQEAQTRILRGLTLTEAIYAVFFANCKISKTTCSLN